jgi:hypothetical protein
MPSSKSGCYSVLSESCNIHGFPNKGNEKIALRLDNMDNGWRRCPAAIPGDILLQDLSAPCTDSDRIAINREAFVHSALALPRLDHSQKPRLITAAPKARKAINRSERVP